jgi:long-chain acyl-CoA synthetase
VAKVREISGQLPHLVGIIRTTGAARDGLERTMAQLEALGQDWAKSNPGAHAARVAALTLDDVASFIYTSGTTGPPKGVVLTHRNWVYQAVAVEKIRLLEADDVLFLFLPLAHSFAQTIAALWFKVGCTFAMAESIDKIVENSGEVRPTVMPSVPRVFEKAYNAVVSKGAATPGLKGLLFRTAMAGLEDFVTAQEQGKPGGGGWKLLLGKKLVFPKLEAALKERFGGRLRRFISGGAPLSPKINWFFDFCGLEVLQGYGLTETSAGTIVNRPGQNHIGTIGVPMPGTEVKLAPDGELLIRGGGVMKEYYRNPTATAEAFRDGWFCTGDIGTIDAHGRVRITDRKKDIIVTAGGKNVAPQNLENDLKTEPFISQVVVHGDKRKFLSALVTLNEENIRKWAAENGTTLAEPLHEDATVQARVQAAFDAVNAKQPSYATIKKTAVLPKDFTQESGELTPTLKVKRKVVSERYRKILDGFYDE